MEEKLEETGFIKPLRNEKGQLLPGQTSNPHGRPKGTVSIVEAIKRKLAEIDPETKRPFLDSVVNAMFVKALSENDVTMLKDLTDRVDGKPKQEIDHLIEDKRLLLD